MVKVVLFDVLFPRVHPRVGEPTFFVNSIIQNNKVHTVRKGKWFKEGMIISPRIWSGVPYRSKQFVFTHPLTIIEVYNFSKLDGLGWFLDNKKISAAMLEIIARNDGLSRKDFTDYFASAKVFDGQIVCWKAVKYS